MLEFSFSARSSLGQITALTLVKVEFTRTECESFL
jgi:hypothetical protein